MRYFAPLMSAKGQKRTKRHLGAMSALPQKRTNRRRLHLSALGQKRTTAPQQSAVSIPLPRRNQGPGYFAYLFKVSIRTLAAGPDEAGFWPVINWPSATV